MRILPPHFCENPEEVIVSNSTLFADLSAFCQTPVTKSAAASATARVTLESLLDRSKTVTTDDGALVMEQIPFLDNNQRQVAYISDGVPQYYRLDSLSAVKKFLVNYRDKETDYRWTYVITLIAEPEYLQLCEGWNISSLEFPNFTGLVLASRVTGEMVKLYSLDNGCVEECAFIKETEATTSGQYRILSLPVLPSTKANDEVIYDEIEACVCESVTPAPKYKFQMETPQAVCQEEEECDDDGGGEGGNDGGGRNEDDSRTKKQPEKVLTIFEVKLSTSGKGTVSGGGKYVKGATAFISAYPNFNYEFSRWTGDLADAGGIGGDKSHVMLTVDQNIISTAYFAKYGEADNYPCKGNPSVQMIVAKSGGWNVKGGTWGRTRYGGSKFHDGIDLKMDPGSPLYAMYDGDIVVIKDKCEFITYQPNRVDGERYPSYYIGKDKNGAGNRFTIKSEINGQIVYISYWHLLEWDEEKGAQCMAVNPRSETGETFHPGDHVYAGDHVAYSGKTGNATQSIVKETHVHIQVYVENNGVLESVDPEPYLNGKRQKNSEYFTNIDCTDKN